MKFLQPLKALQDVEVDARYLLKLFNKCGMVVEERPLLLSTGPDSVRVMTLTGFSARDYVATNAAALLAYSSCARTHIPSVRGALIVPIVNPHAFSSEQTYTDERGVNVFTDFTTLLSTYTERIHGYYMRYKPEVVLVVRGGREFKIYSVDERVSEERGFTYLPDDNIQKPYVHFSFEHSTALLVEVPRDPEAISDVALQLARLAQLKYPRPGAKFVEALIEPEDPEWARRILELHGAKVYEGWRIVGGTLLIERVLTSPYLEELLRARRAGG